jgi:hypothetical protein
MPQLVKRKSATAPGSVAAIGRARGSAGAAALVGGPYNLRMLASEENLVLSADGRCELCGRRVGEDRLTRHHLLPRSRARKMRRRRKSRQELKRHNLDRTVALCGPCHRNVHVCIGNADLARGYDTVEALRDHPGVQRFTEWVKDKPHGRVEWQLPHASETDHT